MEIIQILISQILLMFILMFVGVYLCKTNKLTLEGSKTLGNILLYVVIPLVVIKAYITEVTPEKMMGLVVSLGVSFICLILAMLVSHLFFKKDVVESFGVSFSNAGFIGIPIVSSLFGDEAVFYVSSFVAFVNIFQWTYGVYIFSKDKSYIQPKKILTNPIIISFVAGIILFLLQIKVPKILQTTISTITAMNSPLAMFSLGTYLAQVSFKQLFTNKLAYKASFVRLMIIPLLTLAILSVIPNDFSLLKQTILIVASTPIGSNVAIFAQLYHQEYTQAVIDVCLTTLLSVITLPMVLFISSLIW